MKATRAAGEKRRRRWTLTSGWSVVLIVLALPWTGIASLSMFLELDKVQGESIDPDHAGQIEVLAWSWGASQSGTTHIVGGTDTAKASVQDLSITKYLDKSSPTLLLRLLVGTSIDEGRLEVIEDTKAGPVLVQSLAMENILVTSIATGGSRVEDRLTANFTLNFAEFTFTDHYVPVSGPTVPKSVFWDIPGNTGSGGINLAPSITSIADTSIPEDGSTTLNFSIDDDLTVAGALTLARSTSNPALVPVDGITIGGVGAARTVTIVPAPDQVGTATVGIQVDDGVNFTQETFIVTVTPVNDSPTIDPISPQIMLEGNTLDVDVTVGDIDSDIAIVVLAPTGSTDLALLPLSGITFSGTGSVRTMTLAPTPGQTGLTTVSIEATDGSDPSAPRSFLLSVNSAASGTPTDINLSATLIPENSPDDTEVGVLATVDPNVGDTFTYTLLDDAGGRFKIGGAGADRLLVADGSLLDYELASSHSLTIQTVDAFGNPFTKGFTIAVENVNEGPTITLTPSLLQVLPGIAKPVEGLSFSDPDAGGDDVSVLFSADAGVFNFNDDSPFVGTLSGNNTDALSVVASLANLNAVLAANGLTYRNSDLSALADTVTFLISDLGNTGAGVPLEASTTLPIAITLTKFEIWLRDHYLSYELADPNFVGLESDSDGDTLSVFFEYLLGLDPTVNEPGPHVEMLEVEVEEGGILKRFPAVRFRQLKPFRDPGVALLVEVATDITNWGATTTVHAVGPDTDPYEIVTVRSTIPLSSQSVQQFRLRAVIVPTF